MLLYAVVVGVVAGVISGLLAFCVAEWVKYRRGVDYELRRIVVETSKEMTKSGKWLC